MGDKGRMRFLGAFRNTAESDRQLVMSVRLSVRPHGTTLLPLDGFSQNFIFEVFFENLCRYNSSFITICQQ